MTNVVQMFENPDDRYFHRRVDELKEKYKGRGQVCFIIYKKQLSGPFDDYKYAYNYGIALHGKGSFRLHELDCGK